MDFGAGSQGSDDGSKPKVVNDEDLLLDNFYKKAPGQASAMEIGNIAMPPTPTTLPKQSENQQEYISTHFKQQQIDLL